MGARLIRNHGLSPSRRKQEVRALAIIICAVVLPLILAFLLVAADMRSDLSDLIPAEALPDNTATLIGWSDLEIPENRSLSLEQTRWQPQRRVRMLGYMMDGYADGHKPAPDGAPVSMFILLPEAGQLLHPAHRIPDQMVEIRPVQPALFRFRSLVWVEGALSGTPGRRNPDKALYSMNAAVVQPAFQSDITLWFKP